MLSMASLGAYVLCAGCSAERLSCRIECMSTSEELFVGMQGAETPLHFDERENLFFQVLQTWGRGGGGDGK